MITTENTSSIRNVQKALLDGAFGVSDLVEFYLTKIESSEFTNAYYQVFNEEAISKAKELDQKIQSNESDLGKLFGLVISVKDLICIKGKGISAGSKILDGYVSPFHATAVERLLEEDVIIIGTTNCDEFGMGSSSENSFHGPTKQFSFPTRVPGGSSGGSAVSIQAGTCLISLGTDTGGSVRQPASFCGVIGFKPTYGRVSRYGLIAYASSFDQLGIFGKTIEDISMVLSIVEGEDQKDSTTFQLDSLQNNEADSNDMSLKDGQLKIAVLDEAVSHDGLQSEIQDEIKNIIDKLQHAGNEVSKVSFPLLKYVVPTYYVLTTAEASSNLSRYDGVRYGYRSEKGNDLEEMYRNTRTEGFGAEVKRRIMLGTFVLSSGYYDAYFTHAQKVRNQIVQELDSILNEFDAIILPTAPTTAWEIGAKNHDPVSVYLADIYTVIANLAGLPAVSIPLGQDKNLLPFGLQLIGRRHMDQILLSLSKECSEFLLNQ